MQGLTRTEETAARVVPGALKEPAEPPRGLSRGLKSGGQEGALGWDLHRHKKMGAAEDRSEPEHRPREVEVETHTAVLAVIVH